MQEAKIHPIQIGHVDWDIYVNAVKDFTGESPTRGIDVANISPKKPIAFLKTLDFHNQTHMTIGQEHLYNHSFFSFIVEMDSYDMIDIAARGEVSLAYTEKRSRVLVLMSGTLLQWKRSIINISHKTSSSGARSIINEIQSILETAGFREVWAEIKFYPNNDGTFTCTK